MTGGNGRIWPLSARDLIAVQQRLGPAKPAAMREALPGSTAGWPCPGMTQ
jgi:hypothetical protein